MATLTATTTTLKPTASLVRLGSAAPQPPAHHNGHAPSSVQPDEVTLQRAMQALQREQARESARGHWFNRLVNTVLIADIFGNFFELVGHLLRGLWNLFNN